MKGSIVRRAGRSRGQSSVEYLLCASVLAIALLAPFGGGPSVAERLLDALVRFHRNHIFLVALS